MLDTRLSTLVSPTLDFKSNLCLFHLDLAHEPAWCERLVHTPLLPSSLRAPSLSAELNRQESLTSSQPESLGGGRPLLALAKPFLSNLVACNRGWFTVATVDLGSAKYLVRSCVEGRQKPQFPSRLDAFRKPPTPFQTWEKSLSPWPVGGQVSVGSSKSGVSGVVGYRLHPLFRALCILADFLALLHFHVFGPLSLAL